MAWLASLITVLVISGPCVVGCVGSDKMRGFVVRLDAVIAELAEATRLNQQFQATIENLNDTMSTMTEKNQQLQATVEKMNGTRCK